MSRTASGYARNPRDFYSTPMWPVTEALAHHVAIKGKTAWEPCCGDGAMVRALIEAGAGRVYASDISPQHFDLAQPGFFDALTLPVAVERDFLLEHTRLPKGTELIVTNPPYKLASEFISRGLAHIRDAQNRHAYLMLAFLLPIDFDSALTRAHQFGDCEEFFGKIVLRRRINWIEGTSGQSENHAWFLWAPDPGPFPVLMYAP
jgi:hypothetical protein